MQGSYSSQPITSSGNAIEVPNISGSHLDSGEIVVASDLYS